MASNSFRDVIHESMQFVLVAFPCLFKYCTQQCVYMWRNSLNILSLGRKSVYTFDLMVVVLLYRMLLDMLCLILEHGVSWISSSKLWHWSMRTCVSTVASVTWSAMTRDTRPSPLTQRPTYPTSQRSAHGVLLCDMGKVGLCLLCDVCQRVSHHWLYQGGASEHTISSS